MELLNKIYADGMGPTYDYTPEGRLSRRIWARGITTGYAYDGWGNLTNTVYTDDTPDVSLAYDAMGRQIEAHDAAGTTTFAYDAYGALTNETVIGVAGTNTIERHWDGFGRTAGYALNGERQTTIGYDTATGRITSMLAAGVDEPFAWSYLPGSDLKSSLAYPNGLTASWQYDDNNQLLQVCNATPTNVVSQYDYTYDEAGRRISCAHSGSAFEANDIISYGYNIRGELTNAVAVADADYRYAYQYDDVGNRLWSLESTNRTVYVANCLNQYTAISNFVGTASIPDVFSPQYDDDGNQTLVQTDTGIWAVAYNGENRPVLWSNGETNIEMSYDRKGRRVKKNTQGFVYDGFLQIADNSFNYYVWNPAERVATHPLLCGSRVQPQSFFYTKGGNKNLSEISNDKLDIIAHYEYSPFECIGEHNIMSSMHSCWRFSAEYADDDIGLTYYNYRHYGGLHGRWLCREPMDNIDNNFVNLYLFCENRPEDTYDSLGLSPLSWYRSQKCGKNSIVRQSAEHIEIGRIDIDAYVPQIIEIAGPSGGYPGQGDSAQLFFGVAREYVPWNSMNYRDKESVLELLWSNKTLGCRYKVKFVIDCECVCNDKVLHEWEVSSEWGFVYGKLVWYDLAGTPSCDCSGNYNRFINGAKNKLGNACEL